MTTGLECASIVGAGCTSLGSGVGFSWVLFATGTSVGLVARGEGVFLAVRVPIFSVRLERGDGGEWCMYGKDLGEYIITGGRECQGCLPVTNKCVAPGTARRAVTSRVGFLLRYCWGGIGWMGSGRSRATSSRQGPVWPNGTDALSRATG